VAGARRVGRRLEPSFVESIVTVLVSYD